MWFEKEAGNPALRPMNDPEMENALLIGWDIPDWVRLPDQLGGKKVKVIEGTVGPCPSCKTTHPVRHLTLEGTSIRVAECEEKGFLWYKRRQRKTNISPAL